MNPEEQIPKSKLKKIIKKRRKKSSSRTKNPTDSDSSIEPKTSESTVEDPPLKFYDAEGSITKESADTQTSAISQATSGTVSKNLDQTTSEPAREASTVTKKPVVPDLHSLQ